MFARELYSTLTELINTKRYRTLYSTLLMHGVAAFINDYIEEENECLLLYATLLNDPIAFDILMIFGAKIEPRFQQALSDKLKNHDHSLDVNIQKKITEVLNNDYIIGTKESIFEKIPKEIKRNKQFTAHFGRLTFEFLPEDTLSDNFIYHIRLLHLSHEFVSLVDDATREHPYTIYMVNKEHVPFGAACYINGHYITISIDKPLYERLYSLIFELCNAANNELHKIKKSDHDNADSFALQVETLEYKSYVRALSIIKDIYNANILNATAFKSGKTLGQVIFRHIENDAPEIKKHLALQDEPELIGTASHTEQYREDYRQWKAIQEKNRLQTASSEPSTSIDVMAGSSNPILTFSGPDNRTYYADTATTKSQEAFRSELNSYLALIKSKHDFEPITGKLINDLEDILTKIELKSTEDLHKDMHNIIYNYCHSTSGYFFYSRLGEKLIELGKEFNRDFSYSLFDKMLSFSLH